ncbi:unnamed protein product [Brachionus calyciflorus]|uniref:Uncharacterized protein n=1 Tax=Brachionus calyciflorus TaxID=104777 RepID=A0A813X525_9BILA|nr:unnamed protein product [Brachionus calyciflorus]
MNDLEIFLPCGFTCKYQDLIKSKSRSLCMVCKTHYLYVDECLNMPRNKLILKQSEFDAKYEKLNQVLTDVDKTKIKTEMTINNDFDLMKNEIDIRREELKIQIDNYYFTLLNDLEAKRNLALDEMNKKISELNTFTINKEPSELEPLEKTKYLHENLQRIQNLLNSNEKYLDSVNKFNFKFEQPKFNMNDVFGKISTNKVSLHKLKSDTDLIIEELKEIKKGLKRSFESHILYDDDDDDEDDDEDDFILKNKNLKYEDILNDSDYYY